MEEQRNILEELESFFQKTGGLTLSQLCDIAGIESVTVQNWVKRGFVSRPIGKRYSKEQCARILMIHALRDTMQLDKIAGLISYVNGDLLDTQDDIILDSVLYGYFCHITVGLIEQGELDTGRIQKLIKCELESYQGTVAEREKLQKALRIMALGYGANVLQRRADGLLAEIVL